MGERELDMRVRDLACTVPVPTQGTLDMMWPQWGRAFWREEIVRYIDGHRGDNC